MISYYANPVTEPTAKALTNQETDKMQQNAVFPGHNRTGWSSRRKEQNTKSSAHDTFVSQENSVPVA